jgi:hypothetical protein
MLYNFYICKLSIFSNKLEFLQARSVPWSGAPEGCFAWVSSYLAHKHYIILERHARDKFHSLLQKYNNYCCEKFYNTGSRCQFYKTFCEYE